ncbi:RNA-binding protein 39-like isoform X1 [Triticum dicoccoides]|uniref:RNA-binding protein 39-like isoform X1 n=1 Tax=Triticum dicoccoides TaxID=85692 RepID=UPI00188E42DB|nr:RNA-binding protein 39-like isoform X1 [Triticum dicoccoides]
MDFDEYEYLEKTVEASAAAPANGSDGKERSSRRRSSAGDGEDRDDGERRSKRSRSEHRDRDRDLESRERHRSSRERWDRDVREKERLSRESEREREKERERRSRDRDREREKERERERRSRSRSERRRDDGERERERFRERDFRDRDVRRRKEDGAEPEADPERDQRTVFAFQLSLKADERDVYEFFSRAGKVRDVRLIMDRNSRRSKGVGYIEFYDAMSVPMAIALRGQPLLGQPVDVKPSEAEKNLVQSNASSSVAASGGARKLYVGNLHSNITEEQLRLVFEPFGLVELVQLPVDPLTGLCKGFGFVQFARLEDAKAAQSLNGQLDIAGKVIKVSAVTEQPGVQASGATAGDLDDDEGGGLALNASSRALLMQKLDRSGATTSLTSGLGASAVALPPVSVLGAPATGPVLQPTVPGLGLIPGASIPVITQSVDTAPPSECLLLKNMFDPAVETDPDFDLDIRDDVREECSKFGQVRHIFVDKNTAGFVYLRFDSITAAMGAQKALQGRWFAGKMITATFMSTQQYEMKFPE